MATNRAATSETSRSEPESYFGLVANLAGVFILLGALVYIAVSGEKPVAKIVATVIPKPERPAPTPPPEPVAPVVAPPPAPTNIEPDRAAIASAEAALATATRDRAAAEARAKANARRLADASALAASSSASGRKLGQRLRDPSAQLARIESQGGFLKAERDRLKDELTALARAPRPKAKSLVDKNPVAKPSGGDEYHFEIRRNRVSYIDLERLVTLVKSDAEVRVRVTDSSQRVVESQVGPIGAFSLEYRLAKALPGGIQELMERHSLSYQLIGWEIVPEFDGRGETFETTQRPVSEFARVTNRLNPARTTITMWIYPDGFALFRKLRDVFHERGFLVAARPLPEGMTIRGSPAGSLSAGQ